MHTASIRVTAATGKESYHKNISVPEREQGRALFTPPEYNKVYTGAFTYSLKIFHLNFHPKYKDLFWVLLEIQIKKNITLYIASYIDGFFPGRNKQNYFLKTFN